MRATANIERIRTVHEAVAPLMDERARSHWAAAEAQAYGWGGIRAVSAATRLSPNTIRKGLAEQRVVLTFDLDFGEILAGSAGQVVSVVLFRLHDTRTVHVIERLQAVLDHSSADLQAGAIIVVEERRHRVRKLPIGS
jgi:hypothetical protein